MAKKKYTLRETAELATVFGKSIQTINRWIKRDNIILSHPKAIEALKQAKK